jgi:hypothetical protein
VKKIALLLSFLSFLLLGLLSVVPPATADILSVEVVSAQLVGFLHDIEALGFKARFVVPVHTQSTQVCSPCMTTATGYTLCADPTASPEAPFCHEDTVALTFLVVYEMALSQPCTPD